MGRVKAYWEPRDDKKPVVVKHLGEPGEISLVLVENFLYVEITDIKTGGQAHLFVHPTVSGTDFMGHKDLTIEVKENSLGIPQWVLNEIVVEAISKGDIELLERMVEEKVREKEDVVSRQVRVQVLQEVSEDIDAPRSV